MSEISRRDFFKIGAIIPAGIVTGVALAELSNGIDQEVANITNQPAGNSSERYRIEQEVAAAETPEQQIAAIKYDSAEVVTNAVEVPVTEELFFRTIPSILMDFNKENVVRTTLIGQEAIGLSRREAIVGGITSLIFGLAHNIRGTKFDTKNIPASSTVAGLAYWVLQRNLGAGANITAHSVDNWLLVHRANSKIVR